MNKPSPTVNHPLSTSSPTSGLHPLSGRWPSAVCVLLIIAFTLFFGALAIQQHRTFQTNALDLGNVDQALWNTAQGRFLQFTLMTPVQSRLALHVEPILLLLLPVYWLNLGSPEILLIIQAAAVALGAWPLYQLTIINFQSSNNHSVSRPTPKASTPPSPPTILTSSIPPASVFCLIPPLAYLLFPALESAVLYDFHAVTLAPTFLLFAFLALEQTHHRRFILFILLAMACKEDIPLVVAMLGLYIGLARRQWRLAGLTIALSILWFGLAFFVIQPQFAAGGNIQLDRYAWLGATLPEILQTLLTQPALVFDHLWHQANLLTYLVDLFFPTAYLALFSPLTLLPMLPTLAINLLSDNPFTWRLEDFHYSAPLAPFLFISAVYGIKRINEWANTLTSTNGRMANRQSLIPHVGPIGYSLILLLCSLLLGFSLIYHYYRGYSPLARPFAWPQATPHHQQIMQTLAVIPPETPLFTQSNLAPHLTHRPVIYSDFAYLTDPAYPAPTPAQEILLDVTGFENFGGLHQFLRQELLASGRYELISAHDGILHLRPQAADQRPPNEPPPLETQPTPYSLLPTSYLLPTSIDFGNLVRLRGYTLHFNRQEEVQVTIDLEPLQPLPPDVQPVLYLLDTEGQPLGATTDLPPTLVWYPPEQWPVGQPGQIHFNTLPWYTRQTPAYRLALGFITGSDPWDVSRRHRPAIHSTGDLALRLPADGALLELARIQQVWGMPEGGPPQRQFTAPQPSHPLQVNFDNQIKLLGYSFSPPANLPTFQLSNPLTLTLTWQALASLPLLTRFVQLIGPDGQVYAQNDSAPDRGQYPTWLWQPGEIVEETITLAIPPNLPPGRYTLHIGLYHPDTGARLPLVSGGDHVEIDDLPPMPQ